MKKSLLISAASLAIAATPVFSAFATDINITGDSSKSVTVGEVDAPVYSVDIDWGDLTFDWKYNPFVGEYTFLGKPTCMDIAGKSMGVLSYLADQGNLYAESDFTCTGSKISAEDLDYSQPTGAYRGMMPGGALIELTDSSTNGRIKPSIAFTPEAKYSWVDGVFSTGNAPLIYDYETNSFGYGEYGEEITDGSMSPTMGGFDIAIYDVMMHLEVNDDMGNTEPITTGDKIGTVTINIEPVSN